MITMQDLFAYQVDEVTALHSVVGGLRPTGLRPTFLAKLERKGIPLPESMQPQRRRAPPAPGAGRRGDEACAAGLVARASAAARARAASRPQRRAPTPPTLAAEGPAAKFPERSWLLTLPEKRALTVADVARDRERRAVRDLRLSSGAVAGTAVVLAIDASTSMRGRAIRDAMAAARVIRRARVAPTRSSASSSSAANRASRSSPRPIRRRSTRCSAGAPELSKGTQTCSTPPRTRARAARGSRAQRSRRSCC